MHQAPKQPLADHSDDEIEVILAHELAHHVHRDMWTGIAVETALMTFSFFLADLVLSAGAANLRDRRRWMLGAETAESAWLRRGRNRSEPRHGAVAWP